ncbi:MAG TPA: peptide ABC transporter substrate-binding protein [Candidatus Saccharimonadales bacterium]|nr:peptide ABC transporter substrate-binding protein [Candidatus Saccharimonadales bacterium]
MFRPFQLRFRRRLRKGQRQVEDLGVQAEAGLERNLFRRFERLNAVRRFVLTWCGLFVLLSGVMVWQTINLSAYYQKPEPVAGGIYSEGLQGSFTTANPLYATSAVDSTVSHLIFAGLLQYDDHNHLVGDLAQDYSADDTGKIYTVHLKPGLTWQDGAPLTSADVAYTYHAIQNPDAQSPLGSAWQGVNIATPDARTIVFTLPDSLASFPQSLTNGIVPEHLLKDVPMAELRTVEFNTANPIGAGPFRWHALQVSGTSATDAEEQIALTPFAHYNGGAPKLASFIVQAYANEQQLLNDFRSGQLTAVAGVDSVPSAIAQASGVVQHQFILTAGTYVFFKTSGGVLSDAKVRQALVLGADPATIISKLGYTTRPVRSPLLEGQLGYDPTTLQTTNNVAAAKAALDSDGWVVGAHGVRYKGGMPLQFEFSAADTPENHMVVQQLQEQWGQLGVELNTQFQGSTDFNTTLSSHSYDAVLYGISIGADPDVFVYWDSSQANVLSANRLNLSEYKSTAADTALEAGRTRLDPALRVIKYKPFLQAWQQDNPALGLYQPRFIYLTHGTVYGLVDHALNTGTDRFSDVQNWAIHTANVTQ